MKTRKKSDDTPLDRVVRDRGLKNRSALAEKASCPRQVLALITRGDFGSVAVRRKLRKELGLSVAGLNQVVRECGENYLRQIGEAG